MQVTKAVNEKEVEAFMREAVVMAYVLQT